AVTPEKRRQEERRSRWPWEPFPLDFEKLMRVRPGSSSEHLGLFARHDVIPVGIDAVILARAAVGVHRLVLGVHANALPLLGHPVIRGPPQGELLLLLLRQRLPLVVVRDPQVAADVEGLARLEALALFDLLDRDLDQIVARVFLLAHVHARDGAEDDVGGLAPLFGGAFGERLWGQAECREQSGVADPTTAHSYLREGSVAGLVILYPPAAYPQPSSPRWSRRIRARPAPLPSARWRRQLPAGFAALSWAALRSVRPGVSTVASPGTLPP